MQLTSRVGEPTGLALYWLSFVSASVHAPEHALPAIQKLVSNMSIKYKNSCSKIKIERLYGLLLTFWVKILFCKHYFSPLNIFMSKGKDPEPDPYLWLMDPDHKGPNTCGSCGSGSPTLVKTLYSLMRIRGGKVDKHPGSATLLKRQ